MVLWIGVDDTDRLRSMCTTFLATESVRDLTGGFDLIGYPRLVRLNPNIPWKTRGNGAICLCVGRGRGNAIVAGSIDGHSVRVYHRGATGPEPDDVVERVSALIERWSDLEADGTDPGLVVLRKKPLPGLYWQAGASGNQAAGSSGRRRPARGGRTIARGRSWRIEKRPAGARPGWSIRHPSAEWIGAIRARSTTTTMTATAWSSRPGPLALCCLAYGGTAQLISKRPSRSFGPSPRAAGCSSSPTKVRTTMYSLALPRCLARPADSSVE